MKRICRVLFCLIGMAAWSSSAMAHDVDAVFHNEPNDFTSCLMGEANPCGYARDSLADKHLPAGLMGGHVHDQGEFMLEYR